VLVTTVSYDTTSGTYDPMLIDSHGPTGNKYTVLETIRSSAAAPAFFKGKEMTIDGVKKINYDGAVYANNPAAYGLAYASL